MTPIAVTGVGIVSPIGVGRETFWSRLVAGESGIAPWDRKDEGGPGRAQRYPTIAASIADPSLRKLITSPLARRMDELSRRLVAAARLALSDAALDADGIPSESLGIVVGSLSGNLSGTVEYLNRLFSKGPGLASPMLFPNLVLNAAASYASMELGCTGSNLTLSQLEVSGEQAIAHGCDLIRAGRAEIVLAGGADELTEIGASVYRGVRALAGQAGGREWSSPYDRERSGVVLGEGATLLVLENPERARARGAHCYAEIVDDLSFGLPSRPFSWPKTLSDAPQRLRAWIDRGAGGEIDLICGSASSSRPLDLLELELLSATFTGKPRRPSLTSIKGAIGEFGAAGAMSVAATCLGLSTRTVPPLCHLEDPIADHDFAFAARRGESRDLERAMTIGIARGGLVSALLLRRTSA